MSSRENGGFRAMKFGRLVFWDEILIDLNHIWVAQVGDISRISRIGMISRIDVISRSSAEVDNTLNW